MCLACTKFWIQSQASPIKGSQVEGVGVGVETMPETQTHAVQIGLKSTWVSQLKKWNIETVGAFRRGTWSFCNQWLTRSAFESSIQKGCHRDEMSLTRGFAATRWSFVLCSCQRGNWVCCSRNKEFCGTLKTKDQMPYYIRPLIRVVTAG